jgi:arylsulfatase A-like enzyme
MNTARRPNFLLFITDQQRWDHLGCTGNGVVRTPHIDGIARRGVRFERFYTASPVCMPNRATLMTGRLPSLHGVRTNGIPLSLRAATFVELMRRAGYRTALIGKSHIQNMVGPPPIYQPERANGDPPPPELAEAIMDDWSGAAYSQEIPKFWQDPKHDIALPYYGFDHVELSDEHGDQCFGHYTRWLAQRHKTPDRLMGPENQLPGNTMTVPQAWRTAVPEELYPTFYVAERTEAYLDAWAKGDRSRPFMVQCSFPDPHHPFTPPGRYWDMYDPADMKLPSAFDLGNAPPPPHVAALLAARDAGTRADQRKNAFAINERETREAIALTYGMITMVDDAVGRVLAKLKSLGLDRDTVVAFTADHGDLMGDHQLLLKGPFAYRGLVQVPFLWADPASPGRAGSSCAALCGTLDMAATFLDRAGIAAFNGMQGRSLVPLAEGRATNGHDGVIVEYGMQYPFLGGRGMMTMRSLITERWRITIYSGRDWGELYDLKADPDERFNLWDDRASAGIRAEMAERLARAMMDHAETSPAPTGRA